ncbi:MAG TPA: hypothetical protein VMX14_03695 [Anaerolineae bacterium]|nr:hypothetical protein [Anaerolineae bacterium]
MRCSGHVPACGEGGLCSRTDRGERRHPVLDAHGVRHHGAARESGLERIIILLDESGLSRSAVAAKVLAHNNIVGFSDLQVMAQLSQEITDIDDKLEAFLPEELQAEIEKELDALLAPKLDLQWKTVTLAFLPDQLETFTDLIESIPGRQDLVAVGETNLFDRFVKAVEGFSRFHDVRSANMAIALMAKVGLDVAQTGEVQELEGDWVSLAEVLGGLRVPKEAGAVIKEAVKAVKKDQELKHSWQALELIAADYLAGH